MTYRNADLLALARLAPHCMSCERANDGTVVAAHSNQSRDGKGMSLKASDHAIAYCCRPCHVFIDCGASLSGPERIELWETAHRRTMAWLFEAGHLVVAEEARRPEAPTRPKAKVRRSRKPIPQRADPWLTGRKIASRAKPRQESTR